MAVIASLPSATSSVVIAVTSWWLKDPVDPTVNLAVNVTASNTQRSEQASTFHPLGSTRPVVVADAMEGADGAVEILTITASDYSAVVTLLTRQRTLLLQSPFGEQWYARLNAPRGSSLSASTAAAPWRKHRASYVEVAVP